MNESLKEKFQSYPEHIRPKIDILRALILDVALHTDGAGEIEETLKWGEPSFLTSKTKSGTTLRIDWKPKTPKQYAMYFNCKTTLIDSFKTIFSDTLTFEGNRAILFAVDEALPEQELRLCIKMALRYHLDKRKC